MKTIMPVFFSTSLLILLTCFVPVAAQQKNIDFLKKQQWLLTEMPGKKTPLTQDSAAAAFILFDGAKVKGFAGCNKLTGDFAFNAKNKIAFTNIITTRMMCPDYETEKQLLNALGMADNWTYADNKLILYQGRKLLAKFKPAAISLQD
jgi:heat shock protein HslJ